MTRKKKQLLCEENLRHNEYYGMQDTFDNLYAASKNGEVFTDLMSIVLQRENILLAYRNIKKNTGSKTCGTDKLTIRDIGKCSPDEVVEKVRFIVNGSEHGYRPKPVRRKEIPKPYDPSKTRPLGIPCIWDRLIQQCIKQVMEPVCEAKFSENSYGFRPNHSVENAIARSYKLLQQANLHYGNLITLADFYGVSVDYLLCRTENREQINTPLTELHLNDEMVALLKSGRINNRLLCELATHKDFIKFLADIEIYVDGIATMQIQNLNSLVDTVRHEIIERYRPGEDDPHLKVLQAAHISDDEYFSHMVLDDLNLIIRDIREFHKKDSESAPQTTVADELKENLEAVENFKGSRDEKLVILYCKQLGINYKNLSEEEFRWFIRILKKSKKMGTPISQRKKR